MLNGLDLSGRINGLDLFSGVGGLALALAPWVRPVAYCEIDRYAQSVLLSRMADGSLPTAPIWDDIKSMGHAQLDVPIDIITGGFPCQDISFAGPGAGLAGERSRLYWEIHRLVGELQPRWVYLENVPAIIARGGTQVVASLTQLGYDCRWCVIPVGDGANWNRWFLLARLAEANRDGLQADRRRTGTGSWILSKPAGSHWRQTSPELVGKGDVLPSRLDRVRCLGNAVVPLQARRAFEILSGIGN